MSESDAGAADRAQALLQIGPGAGALSRRGLRRRVRSGLLRLIGPFSHYQRELDGAILDAVRQLQAGLDAAVAQERATFDRVAARQDERQQRAEDLFVEVIHAIDAVRNRVQRLEETDAERSRLIPEYRERLGVQETALEKLSAELHARPFLSDDRLGAFEVPDVGEVLGYRALGQPRAGSDGPAGEDTYARLEDAFRGPKDRVTELQRPYLPLVRAHVPVLDVGCGRGEFLQLLSAQGIDASGVDSDSGMVARCRALGLRVAEGDGLEHLMGLTDGQLGTVFSAQVVEHIPYPILVRLLDVALRKLAPGGLFIAETVNPHRLASLKNFWVDPTHQHPLFPELMLELAAIAGYATAFVFAPGFAEWEEALLEAPSYALVAAAP